MIIKLLISFTSSHLRYCSLPVSSSCFSSSSLCLFWVSFFWTLWFCYSISKSLLVLGSGCSQIRAARLSTRPPHRGQVQCTEPEPRKKASALFNSPCCDVILLWAYIIFRNNSSNGTDKKYIFFNYFIFFSNHFRCPLWMTAFAYTACAQGQLCVEPKLKMSL